jgi:hypothetical protein
MAQDITAYIRIRGDIDSLNKAGIKFAEIVAKAWNMQVVDNRHDPKRDTSDYGVEIIEGDDIPVAFRVKYRDKWEDTLRDTYKRILLLGGTKGLIIDVDRYDLSAGSGYSASLFGVKDDGKIDGIMTERYGLFDESRETGGVEAKA